MTPFDLVIASDIVENIFPRLFVFWISRVLLVGTFLAISLRDGFSALVFTKHVVFLHVVSNVAGNLSVCLSCMYSRSLFYRHVLAVSIFLHVSAVNRLPWGNG